MSDCDYGDDDYDSYCGDDYSFGDDGDIDGNEYDGNENDPTDDDNTAAEDNNDGHDDPNEEEDAQDIYDELLEQCYPSDYLCAHSDELDYCGSYPQQNDDEYFDDSDDSEDNGQPEVNCRDEYDAWAQGVNNAVLKQSLPFPYIFAHMDDLGYRDGSNSFLVAAPGLRAIPVLVYIILVQ